MEFLSFMYEIRGSECEGVSRWWDGWDDTVDGRVGKRMGKPSVVLSGVAALAAA